MDEPLTGQSHWQDGAGVEWRRRHGQISIARIRRHMPDSLVEVVHQYGDEIEAVAPPARPDLLALVEPYLTDRADRSTGDHTEFHVAEFKSPDHRSLLVFSEFC